MAFFVSFKKRKAAQAIAASLIFLMLGAWMIFDGIFVSFDHSGGSWLSRESLKSSVLANTIESVAGAIAVVIAVKGYLRHRGVFKPRPRPYFIIDEKGIWWAEQKNDQPIGWNEISEIAVVKGAGRREPTLEIHFREKQKYKSFILNGDKLELLLDGLDKSIEEFEEAITFYRSPSAL